MGNVECDELAVFFDDFIFATEVAEFGRVTDLDGNDPAANAADDGAIDSTRTARLPGDSFAPSYVTANTQGINGVMLDVIGFPNVSSLGVGGFEPLGRFRAGPIGSAINEDEFQLTIRYRF